MYVTSFNLISSATDIYGRNENLFLGFGRNRLIIKFAIIWKVQRPNCHKPLFKLINSKLMTVGCKGTCVGLDCHDEAAVYMLESLVAAILFF